MTNQNKTFYNVNSMRYANAQKKRYRNVIITTLLKQLD